MKAVMMTMPSMLCSSHGCIPSPHEWQTEKGLWMNYGQEVKGYRGIRLEMIKPLRCLKSQLIQSTNPKTEWKTFRVRRLRRIDLHGCISCKTEFHVWFDTTIVQFINTLHSAASPCTSRNLMPCWRLAEATTFVSPHPEQQPKKEEPRFIRKLIWNMCKEPERFQVETLELLRFSLTDDEL
ncbi:uncharacterized protein V6R79_004537 [Siganus canaliculatus]